MTKSTGADEEGRALLRALALGQPVAERDFDLLFPTHVRKLSRAHWTTLAAAHRAAAMLVDRPAAKVLDVGSGGGKLCIVGSTTTKGVFTGVEHDRELVRVAKDVCRRHHVERVRFVEGDALAMDWAPFDAVYLFNPFANDVGVTKHGIETRPVDEQDFKRSVFAAMTKLVALRPGTRVVTYHGIGATMPPELVETQTEIVGPGILQLWVRA